MKKLKDSLLSVLFIVCCTHLQAKVYLVSAGIADYPGKKKDLRVSDNDAKTIAKLYDATKDATVSLLINEDATQASLLSTMHTTFEEALENDIVIFYFSGHGSQGAIACYDGLLSYQHIFKMLKGCKANSKIIIVDACYSGKMRTNNQSTNIYKNQNVVLFLSSRTNERSQESRYMNSLFTIYLERGLRGGADFNNDRTITAREIYDFVHKGVIEASENTQHPVMWGQYEDNMKIIKW